MFDVNVKRFDPPDETRSFPKGRFDLVHVGGITIGLATYEPGWKWSVDIGRSAGLRYCTTEHVGTVVAGRAVAAMEDGRVVELTAGDVFHIAPGHDSWVLGDEPYVSLHLIGATEYALVIERTALRVDR
jgi:mannose-6-phosphate isomerase-like protein (cupin superfamily)